MNKFLLLLIGVTFAISTHAAMGPLKVSIDNPRYFADPDGNVVYLTGSHTWAVFQERGVEGETPDFDYPAFLDFLVDHNHNFFRFWTWEHSTWMQFADRNTRVRYKPSCYLRTGPGNALDGQPKFDVTKFNPAYFERLRDRIFAAREKGLYVGIMLFQGFSIQQKGTEGVNPDLGNPWDGHPYNKRNNVNNVNGDLNNNGEGEEVHTLANERITRLQEAYVTKTIDTLNGFDNVIWEIGNECDGRSTEWQYHMIQFIREYEKTKPMQHPVWMTFQWDQTHPGVNPNLFDSPADAISPNDDGGYRDNPPDAMGKKVVITDTDHLDPWLKNIDYTWVWKSFTRGLNPILMDTYKDYRPKPPEKDSDFEMARKAMGQTLLFAKIADLANMVPHNELCSTGYCLADPGDEYIAYQPESEKLFWVDLPAGTYQVDLFSPKEGKIKTTIGVQSKERKKQLIPIFFYGDIVAHIKKATFENQEENEVQ